MSSSPQCSGWCVCVCVCVLKWVGGGRTLPLPLLPLRTSRSSSSLSSPRTHGVATVVAPRLNSIQSFYHTVVFCNDNDKVEIDVSHTETSPAHGHDARKHTHNIVYDVFVSFWVFFFCVTCK